MLELKFFTHRMPSYREDIRLKVELNFRIKFYVKLSIRDSLQDLKKLIDSILKHNYQIKLPHYYIRTADGFEVLDIFKIGDILDDNQLIMLDPFNTNSNYSNALSSSKIDKSKTEALVSEFNSSPSSLIKSKQDTIHKSTPSARYGTKDVAKILKDETKEDNYDIMEKEAPAQYESARKKTHEIEKSGNVKHITPELAKNEGIKLKSHEPLKNDSKKNLIKNDENEKATVKQENASIETNRPPKPDNFKGFTVAKADLIKTPGLKFEEEGSFKPLKKRKTEEEPYDII